MEESIVSIYDLLLKRQRQLRKDNIQAKTIVVATTSNVESPVVEKPVAEGTPIPRTRVTRELRQNRSTAGANVICASHLTRKQTGLNIPSLHKRDVIDKLVTRMTGGEAKKTIQTLPTASASVSTAAPAQTPAPATQNAEEVPAATKKVKSHSKSNKKKTSSKNSDNVSKFSMRRLALSPRNNLSNIKDERKQGNRSHIPFNIPIEIYPNSIRSKRRPKPRKSKLAISSNLDRISSDELNTVNYRL